MTTVKRDRETKRQRERETERERERESQRERERERERVSERERETSACLCRPCVAHVYAALLYSSNVIA